MSLKNIKTPLLIIISIIILAVVIFFVIKSSQKFVWDEAAIAVFNAVQDPYYQHLPIKYKLYPKGTDPDTIPYTPLIPSRYSVRVNFAGGTDVVCQAMLDGKNTSTNKILLPGGRYICVVGLDRSGELVAEIKKI